MKLTEHENIQKYAKHCGHCPQNIIIPYEYESSCFGYGYNVIKRKHELSKIQRKRINFINRLKYAEHKIFCICVDVFENNEGIDYDKIYEVLLTLKNEKVKINNILIENHKDMVENLDFEQNYCSRTAEDVYKFGHDSIRLMKWLTYYDRSYYVKINCFDLMGSVLKNLFEFS